MRARILTTGFEEALLQSRASILRAQYDTDVTPPEKVLAQLKKEEYRLLLVCYSIPDDAAIQLIRAVRHGFPGVWIVRLYAIDSPILKDSIADRAVTVNYRPQAWLRVVDELISKNAEGNPTDHERA